MIKSFNEWMSEGESIYAEAMTEYQSLEAQIAQLEARVGEKKAEVNQIAQMIGRPLIEGSKRVSASIVEHVPPNTTVVGSMTRALTGRGLVAK